MKATVYTADGPLIVMDAIEALEVLVSLPPGEGAVVWVHAEEQEVRMR